MQRLILGAGLGGGVTFLLFVIMAFLIKTEFEPPEKSESELVQINIEEQEEEMKVRNRRLPKKPEPPKAPPPEQRRQIPKVQKPMPAEINMNLANLDVNVGGDTYLGQIGGSMSDGEAIPMVVIEPVYPRKAAMDGVEGWVRFQFTVGPDGTPINVEVIDADPKRVFEKDARRAIYKWKFKPKVVDGVAVEQPGMRYTMEFKLGQ